MDDCIEILLVHLVKTDDNLIDIQELLDGGADPNYRLIYGRTPLHEAVGSNQENTEVVEELIRYGANVNFYDDFGYTALHYAVMQQKFYVVEALLQAGAFINAKTFLGETALHLAVNAFKYVPQSQDPDTSVIESLLDHEGVDCNTKDSNGNTPLMLAVKGKSSLAVELLLNKKASPNIPDDLSETPLHVAFAEKSEPIAFELLRMGANIYAVNRDNQTPMDIFFDNMTPNEPFSTAQTFLKFISFRYQVTEAIKQKLQRFPELLQLVEKWCEEVNRMRSDILIYNIPFHGFILNCYGDPENPQYPEYLILEMYKCIIERFVMGLYPEYFMDIFVCIPASSLREVLQKVVDWRKKSKWCNDPVLFSNIDITYLLSSYLSRLEMFCLIVSLSNVQVPESMQNICVPKFS
ncbi:putative ankyrin repeat protein FPV162 like protein [Argiope bruennichi]|uniref:Putative ankyrin repeat protein FPV162 like protein n=1 Tax=Argiope bruennichi TaxID=94029 RepID=A0A8T0EPW7_ARGBR|nr:putative ankyrin repeat protein FPV162 like protein [Argiope bruennichi]